MTNARWMSLRRQKQEISRSKLTSKTNYITKLWGGLRESGLVNKVKEQPRRTPDSNLEPPACTRTHVCPRAGTHHTHVWKIWNKKIPKVLVRWLQEASPLNIHFSRQVDENVLWWLPQIVTEL